MKRLYIDIMKDVKGVRAFFSTKHGASNGSPYYNRAVLQELALTDKTLAQPQQVHEAKIGIIGTDGWRIIDEEGDVVMAWRCDEEGPVIGAWSQGGKMVQESPEFTEPADTSVHNNSNNIRFPRTDGVITNRKDVLLTTVHADCLAVWFFDEENQAIGLVHAGWRGTLAGIAPKAVKLMKETYGSDPSKIKAAIGPGISRCCFETGPEVIEAFREEWDFADKYAEPAVKRQGGKEGKYYIDLKGINVEELLQAGLLRENIEVSGHCTHCEPDMFASYRREGGTYMRMGAGVCLE